MLLHGLTATRRYVVMGSRLLERRGCRLLAYDARGHGESTAAPAAEAYEYGDLVADLRAVLDRLEIERAVLIGSSMGAATALAFALEAPERVAAIVQATPAYAGAPDDDPEKGAEWRALADGLERSGVDGFMEAFEPGVKARWRDSVLRLTRQRLERHRDLDAVADAITVVPRSAPFEGLAALAEIASPSLVVGSHDGADPGHPLAVAERWSETLPDADFVVEEEGEVPLAWQGGRLSKAVAGFLDRGA